MKMSILDPPTQSLADVIYRWYLVMALGSGQTSRSQNSPSLAMAAGSWSPLVTKTLGFVVMVFVKFVLSSRNLFSTGLYKYVTLCVE